MQCERLGGCISTLPTPSNGRENITEQPESMRSSALMRHVCKGAMCAKCECLDKCGYGKEAVKRGLVE